LSHDADTKENSISQLAQFCSDSYHRPPYVGCRRASRLAGRRPFTHSDQRKNFCSLARRPCLRATPIFALCSDHCKKNNGNNERNAFVNPFWVEHDLNPFTKPYRQYYSAFLVAEVTPRDLEHPGTAVLEALTPKERQSPASIVPVEEEVKTITSISPQSIESQRITQSPTSSNTAPQASTPVEKEAIEGPSTTSSVEASIRRDR
jgi:hypothetical protein